jgi:hypothetical protein
MTHEVTNALKFKPSDAHKFMLCHPCRHGSLCAEGLRYLPHG